MRSYAATHAAGSKRRAGLSLLEVLVSVFVLMVGLLGMAAVVPIGQYQIVQAMRAERSTACGRSALKELKVRGWLDPEKWLTWDTSLSDMPTSLYKDTPNATPKNTRRYQPDYFGGAIADILPALTPVSAPYQDLMTLDSSRRSIRWRDSFCIDPLFIETPRNFAALQAADTGNVADWDECLQLRKFPFCGTANNNEPGFSVSALTSMQRVTLTRWPARMPASPPYFADPATGQLRRNAYRLPWPAIEDVFTWQDDQIVEVPSDAENRPRQVVRWQQGSPPGQVVRVAGAFPPRPEDRSTINVATDPALAREAEGSYSWMATVTPLIGAPDFCQDNYNGTIGPRAYTYTDRLTRYEVSVVVFFNRQLEIRNEVLDYPRWIFEPANYVSELVANPPPERTVMARIEGDGIGGGEAMLLPVVPAGLNPAQRQAIQTAWLGLRENQWIMLMAQEQTYHPPAVEPIPAQALPPRMVYKWYRIVAADAVGTEDVNLNGVLDTAPAKYLGEDINDNNVIDVCQRVTLEGPDWDVDTTGHGWSGHSAPKAHHDYGQPPNTWAVIVDNVAGVYTTTVEIDP